MADNSFHDQNHTPTLTAVSSTDGVAIVNVWADPNTHRLLTSSSGGSGSVTSITAGTGLTATPTNPITTTGTILLDSKLSPLDTLGTAGQLIRVNAGATALEYFTSSSGGVVSVTGTSNRISVNNADPANPVVDIAATYVGQTSITTLGTVTTGTWSGTTIAINKGGTGQTTKAAAFDALSPMTTGGDIIYGGASGTGTRLANGSAGQVLTSAGTTVAPTWATPTTGTVTSVSGTANRITSTGGATPVIDISASYVGQSSITTLGTITTGVWNGTTIAIANGGTGQTSKAAAFDALSPMSASGDIIYGGTSGTGTRLAKGSDGQVLTLASGLPSWAAGPAAALVVGTTTVTSGTTTRILYDNAGVLGEYTLTGTGTVVAMQTSPSFTTPAIGVATGTSLALSGVASVGTNSGTNGQITFSGSTSGSVTLKVAAIAGTGTNFQLPATNGSNTNVLITDGSGNTSWAAAGTGTVTAVSVATANGFAGSSSGGATPALTLTTTVNSPVLAGNGTAISAATVTGTGSTVVLSVSPALTGSPTAPTQSTGDNTTKIATDAFVTTAIANAIAGVNPAVAVSYATTAAGNTSGLTYSNGASGIGATMTGANNTTTTFDGHTFVIGDVGVTRVLIKNDTQSPSGAFNGVYLFTALHTAGTGDIFTRALDYDTPSDINSTGAIPVVSGTANADTSWLLTSSVTTMGTDPLTYIQFTLNPTTIVVGPASATDSVPALFDGTTGKLIKNSTPTGTGNPVMQTSPTLITPTLGVATANQVIMTSNAITATSNAATVPITSRISTVTNNSAATLTITITTTSAVDGQMVMVRVLDSSGAAQTITWVNTENSTITAPTTSNGSTTLPLTVGFQFNANTTKWRCIGAA